MRIYIASPYGRRAGKSPDEIGTWVMYANKIAGVLVKWGHTPFVPHNYHYVHELMNEKVDEDRWFSIVSEWIQFCDALFRTGSDSDGADREVAIAQELGIPVYFHLDDIPYRG